MSFVIATLAAIASPGAVDATIDIGRKVEVCDPGAGTEIVVCGERRPRTYRVDPALIDVERALDAPADRRAPAHHTMGTEKCLPHGGNPCPGYGKIPVTAIAFKALQVGVAAATGEDWREPLRTRPDEYRLYRDAKAKRKKAAIAIEFSSGPRDRQ